MGKPCCHNVFDGQKMIEASRKYNVRVQVRFQNRSGKNLNEAMKFLHEGGIGDVYMARGFCLKPRDSFGIAKDSEPHATLHYDTWLGLAPYRPYNEKRVHYNYHWFWDTGNGDKGAQRPHQLDVHWVGGDPGKGEVYGYAAWSTKKATLTLRNPSKLEKTFEVNVSKVFELPGNVKSNYIFYDAKKAVTGKKQSLAHSESFLITLQPFEVKVMNAQPEK